MSVSGSGSLGQSITQQLQLQQAQRDAAAARLRAQSLSAEARDAQLTADRAQERARAVKVDAGQAQDISDQADQNLQVLKSWLLKKTQLGDIYTRVAETQKKAAAQPVTNTRGQVTGKLVNVTA